MKKSFWTKFVVVFVVAVLLFSFAGSLSASSPAPAEKQPKVALIMEGAITDMSWIYTAHQGLVKIEKLGAEVAYLVC